MVFGTCMPGEYCMDVSMCGIVFKQVFTKNEVGWIRHVNFKCLYKDGLDTVKLKY